ncbi:MAG TPA: hypothetical protein DER07_09510 [Armatimonadetes bacterium]|nr:hypothetical protein [Armatimonadota bacterium]
MIACLLALALQVPSPSGWHPMPLVSNELKSRGFSGGEGGQWPRAIACDSTGTFLLLGVDVGGIYRSLDSGRTWEPANVGFLGRGAAGLAIDPRNPKRALAIATNTSVFERNGVYLTEDGAASWRPVFTAAISGNEFRKQVAFVPSQGDGRWTRLAFWSRVANDQPSYGSAKSEPGLYRSDDGGRSWRLLPRTERFGGAILEPAGDGRLWIGTRDGLHLFDPGTNSSRLVRSGEVTGVSAVASKPRSVWVCGPRELAVSSDAGQTWAKLDIGPLLRPEHRLRDVAVSPADPRRIWIWAETEPNDWNWPRFVSHDGGRSWRVAAKNSLGAFLPDNTRQGIAVWHPKNPNVLWSLGGDWPTRSDDGGRSVRYSGTGYACLFVGGRFAFSRSDPDVVFLASQDYNGALTTDGGATWTYTNVSGHPWGGFAYGGYALNRSVLAAGDADGWGAPRRLKVSRDGGRTWTDTGLVNQGLDAGFGWSKDPRVAFVGDLRTEDLGATWARMEGCHGVLADGPGGELFGVRRGAAHSVVRSDDGGRTWSVLFDWPEEVTDLAWDPTRGRLYFVSGLRARFWQRGAIQDLDTPTDATGQRRVRTVAVDPKRPEFVYVGSAAHVWSYGASVARSLDAGRTWSVLTLQAPLATGQKDGGREADTVRVHPRTGWVWVATSCYGQWRYPPPPGR